MEAAMAVTTTTTTSKRPSAASRHTGYVISVLVNAAVLYVLYVEPGWRELPILTDDTPRVLGLLSLSLMVTIVSNLIYLVDDPRSLVTFGGLVSMVVGLAMLAQVWRVFPFDFADTPTNWALVVRVVLVVSIIGCAIGLIVQVGTLIRITTGRAW